MAKPEEQASPQSTNTLLAAILKQEQANGATLNQILTTTQLSLKVATDSRDYLKQLVDSITGDGHVFTVVVKQVAKAVAAELKK